MTARCLRTILVILITWPITGVLRASTYLSEGNWGIQRDGLATVEVTGALKGSGFFVLLDGEVVVLTNSHNLKGRSSALLRLPTRRHNVVRNAPNVTWSEKVEFAGDAQVIIDDPLYDFAFLRLPTSLSKEIRDVLGVYAQENGSFCWQATPCRGWSTSSGHSVYLNTLTAIIDGRPVAVRIPEGIKLRQSTTYLTLNAYARPGFSGGAFYYQGKTHGLITKISLAGAPETKVMPLSIIGQRLLTSTYPSSDSWWENGALMVRHLTNQFQIGAANNGGGESGNGGGESGNGGGESGNGGGESGNGGGESGNGGQPTQGNYIGLSVTDVLGYETVSTWNPFSARRSVFLSNGTKVLYFKQGKQLLGPSTENLIDLQRLNKKFEVITESLATVTGLQQQRLLKQLGMNRIRPLHFSDGRYNAITNFAAGGVMPLFPKRQAMAPLLIAKQSQDCLLDLLTMSYDKNDGFHLKAINGQDELKIVLDSQELTLKRTDSASVFRDLYTDSEKQVEVLYLYNTLDISAVERILIRTGNMLYEVWREE